MYPGIEIHATVIDNILTKNFLARPDWSKVYDLLAIVGAGGGDRALAPEDARDRGPRCSRRGSSPSTSWSPAGCSCTARVWLDLVYPLLALSVTYWC